MSESLPGQARVVVIGAGVTGCSMAYHLAKEGVKDVVVLEKHGIASGATQHAAGLVTVYNTAMDIVQLRVYSIEMYNAFYREAGDACGWNPTGSIRIAGSEDHDKFLRYGMSKARGIGLELEFLDAKSMGRHWPEMSLEGVTGGLYLPQDGWVHPQKMTRFLANKAKEHGTSIHTDVLVTGIERGTGNEIKAVETSRGRIECEAVINAAGMWSARVAAMAGLHMPIVPVCHQHVLTAPLETHRFPSDKPVLRDPHNLIYIREHEGGVLIGGFELNPVSWQENGVPWSHGDRQLDPDWPLFKSILDGAHVRVPLLKQAEVRDLVNHPDGMTPNFLPCVGPSPEVPGFWGASGLSFNGFGMAGGLGNEVARWFIEGQTRIDLTNYDIRRFGAHYRKLDYVSARAREVYKYYYYPKLPLDEFEWGRPYRKSPLHERLQANGAVFGEKNAFERANCFDRGKPGRLAGADQSQGYRWGRPSDDHLVEAEHHAIRQGVGILDMSSFGKIDVSGPDALALLQKVAANEIDQPVGKLIYTLFLNERGGIEGDLTIARIAEDEFRLVTGTSTVTIITGWLHYHSTGMAQVNIAEVTEDHGCISVWGPRSRSVLSQVTGASLDNDSFPYLSCRKIDVAARPVLANRVSFAGELGWELYSSKRDALAVWDALIDAGRDHEIIPCGYRAIDSLRLEKGFLNWGVDITPNDNPIDAGLEFTVKQRKPVFNGKEALRKLGPGDSRKRMTTLISEDPGLRAYGGEAVYCQGKLVGRLRSAGYGYTIGATIGLAYLPAEARANGSGSDCEIESLGKRYPAKVAPSCLYDPKALKPRM